VNGRRVSNTELKERLVELGSDVKEIKNKLMLCAVHSEQLKELEKRQDDTNRNLFAVGLGLVLAALGAVLAWLKA
jgi:hypothetical protein